MRVCHSTFLAVAALAVAAGAGCGGGSSNPDAPIDAVVTPDGPPTAARFSGFWLMTSVTLSGQPAPLTRNGDPLSIRGDIVAAATSDTALLFDVRQVALDHGLVASEIQTFSIPVTLDGDLFVMSVPDGVAVYDAALTGDHLVLSFVATDPRNTASEPPTEIVIDRAPPWTTAAIGTWDLVTMQLPSQTVTAGLCTLVGPSTWAIATMQVSITGRLIFQRTLSTTTYAEETCTTITLAETTVQHGLAEEEGGTALRIWGREEATSEYIAFTMSFAGDEVTLVRTACLPAPDCASTAPVQLVLVRAQ